MKSTYDAKADAVYIYLEADIAAGAVARTLRVRGCEQVALDMAHDGRILGIEILDAQAFVPALTVSPAPSQKA